MNTTAVVILNYNGRDLLSKFLPAVIKFSAGTRIIVADNASTDGSDQLLATEFPSVELIRIHKNLGFCGGYNFALARVEADQYVLLNSDVEVTEGWLEPMVRLLEKDPRIVAVHPKMLSWHERTKFEYAGAGGGFIDTLGYPFCRGRIFDTVETDHGQYDDACPVFWATGACLMIRAAQFREMGGFDEDFFAHMEEIDLCWKLHRHGWKVFYTGESKVYHVGGGTLSKLNSHKTYLNFRNGLSLIFKNMTAGELIWKLPVRIVLDWIAAFRFLTEGSATNAGAVLKAHLHFVSGLPGGIKKRGEMKRPGFRDRSSEIYSGSIILEYYLRGRKTFSSLRPRWTRPGSSQI